MPRLKCFRIGVDTVIAADEADARLVLDETCGPGEVERDVPCKEIPGDSTIMIPLDTAPPPTDCDCASWVLVLECCSNGHRMGCLIGCPMRSAAEWVEINGRGLLCSWEI